MSALQRTEQVVSQSAKIVKRMVGGVETYHLVDVNVMFPDGVWDLIKSYAIPKKIHPYQKIRPKEKQFKEALQKWKKPDLVKMIDVWWNCEQVRKWKDTKSSAYKNTTKTYMINEWGDYIFGATLHRTCSRWSDKLRKVVNKKMKHITPEVMEELRDLNNMIDLIIETKDYKKDFADYLL
jgi:hypothetical protein